MSVYITSICDGRLVCFMNLFLFYVYVVDNGTGCWRVNCEAQCCQRANCMYGCFKETFYTKRNNNRVIWRYSVSCVLCCRNDSSHAFFNILTLLVPCSVTKVLIYKTNMCTSIILLHVSAEIRHRQGVCTTIFQT